MIEIRTVHIYGIGVSPGFVLKIPIADLVTSASSLVSLMLRDLARWFLTLLATTPAMVRTNQRPDTQSVDQSEAMMSEMSYSSILMVRLTRCDCPCVLCPVTLLYLLMAFAMLLTTM